ncbi:MAG: nuclear transport factor 2 family protein [Bacteroidia bacterium]|nr:nuclear transport factor 2 family protein [Bacteroidia bacterium]
MSYKQKAQEMYAMIGQGKGMEAFEHYYDDNVEMIEATGQHRKGKDENRKFEQEWFASVQEVHAGGTNAITSDEESGVTMVESWMDVTFKDGNRIKMEEIARQKWQGDKIIEERFYYNAAPPSDN